MRDFDDPYQLDIMQTYALDQALDWMAKFEHNGNRSAVNAAHAYAAIAVAVGSRLNAVGGVPDDHPPSLCGDCGVDVAPLPPDRDWQWFMVTDEVWVKAGMPFKGGGYLCLSCLESRLQRPLTGLDLMPEVPINERNDFDSPRLAELKAAAALRKEPVR